MLVQTRNDNGILFEGTEGRICVNRGETRSENPVGSKGREDRRRPPGSIIRGPRAEKWLCHRGVIGGGEGLTCVGLRDAEFIPPLFTRPPIPRI